MLYLGSQKLTPEMKKKFLEFAKFDRVKILKEGFYSDLFVVKDANGKFVRFRYYKENGKLIIVTAPLSYDLLNTKERIGFHDKELEGTLTIPKALFLKACKEEEANFNLSEEQKELLMEGKEISVSIITKNSSNIKNNSKTQSKDILISKSKEYLMKTIKIDWYYFLSKNTPLFKESKGLNQSLKLNNI